MQAPEPAEMHARLLALPNVAAIASALEDVPGVHAVGGVPRDLLLDREPRDLDLVVAGDAVAAARSAAAALGGSAIEHERFGTATVLADRLSFDIAAARSERYPAPGALPEVELADLEHDLLRRDFTVNAIAQPLHAPGALLSAPEALADLAAHRLRVLHDSSFIDDPTRVLRLARYASRLEFEVDEGTERLAQAAMRGGAMATLTGARIGEELRLVLGEADAPAALEACADLLALHFLHRDLELDAGLLYGAGGLLPADGGRADLLCLAACCRRFDPDELQRWLDDLAFTAADRRRVVATALGAAPLARALGAAAEPSAIAAAARAAPLEAVALAGALGAEEAARHWLEELRHVRLEIDGRDLAGAGVSEGPAVGRALQAALDAKLDGRAEDRDAELRVALAAL